VIDYQIESAAGRVGSAPLVPATLAGWHAQHRSAGVDAARPPVMARVDLVTLRASQQPRKLDNGINSSLSFLLYGAAANGKMPGSQARRMRCACPPCSRCRR